MSKVFIHNIRVDHLCCDDFSRVLKYDHWDFVKNNSFLEWFLDLFRTDKHQKATKLLYSLTKDIKGSTCFKKSFYRFQKLKELAYPNDGLFVVDFESDPNYLYFKVDGKVVYRLKTKMLSKKDKELKDYYLFNHSQKFKEELIEFLVHKTEVSVIDDNNAVTYSGIPYIPLVKNMTSEQYDRFVQVQRSSREEDVSRYYQSVYMDLLYDFKRDLLINNKDLYQSVGHQFSNEKLYQPLYVVEMDQSNVVISNFIKKIKSNKQAEMFNYIASTHGAHGIMQKITKTYPSYQFNSFLDISFKYGFDYDDNSVMVSIKLAQHADRYVSDKNFVVNLQFKISYQGVLSCSFVDISMIQR